MAGGKKEHIKRIRESKFNRQRADTPTLRSNCTTGYIFTFNASARGQSQFHHILCIKSMQDSHIQPKDKLKFFRDCMAMTVWDTNDGPNLISLPTKKVYLSSDRGYIGAMQTALQVAIPSLANAQAQSGSFGSLPNLPCHEVEHEEYRLEVINWLRDNVWKPLAKEAKNCEIDGKSIQGELEYGSFQWRQFLVERGAEQGGAAKCWIDRNQPGMANVWYLPFSMNPGTPRKALPPPDYRSRTETMKKWLKGLFG